jgi:hypothetical protein
MACSRVNCIFTPSYVVLPSAVFILDIFVWQQCLSSNLKAPSLQGKYLVVSIVTSSHCYRIGSSVLCDGDLNILPVLLFTVQKPGAKEEEQPDIGEISDISSL